MVNGLGVLGWGVGGIEAEAAMLGQPMSMLIPQVVGVKLTGDLREGATATDLVLTVAELLRRTGVVGKFVDFYGPGVANVPLATRATIGNMSPEYGSTCAIFPIDDETLDYLRLTGRPERQIRLVEAYAKEQGLWHDPDHEPDYSQTIELDLATRRAVDRRAEASRRTGSRWPPPNTRSGACSPVSRSPSRCRAGSTRRRPSRSRPATRSRSARDSRRDEPPRTCVCATPHDWPIDPVPVTLRRWQHGERRPRARGDRRDHVVHQHVQPVGDDRRRAAGQEGGGAGADQPSRG